jgi:hypothetical protein
LALDEFLDRPEPPCQTIPDMENWQPYTGINFQG